MYANAYSKWEVLSMTQTAVRKSRRTRAQYPFTFANGIEVLLTSPNELEPRPYTVGYVRDRRSGNWICSWVDESMNSRSPKRRQEIVVLYRGLFRVFPSISPEAYAGRMPATHNELVALGFVPPEGRKEVTVV